ncbi:MAG: vWA domain-containing protein [Chloroflexota bacterium]
MAKQSIANQMLNKIMGAATLSVLLALPPASAYADNPGTGQTSQGQELNILIDEAVIGAAVNWQGQTLPINGTTAIGSLEGQANVLYVVDVSGSASGPTGQDCDGSGVVDNADDFNGNGSIGDTLDCEISGVLALNDSLTSNATVSAGLVLFGSSAAIADIDPRDGDQNFTTPLNVDHNSNGDADIAEVAKSLTGGAISLFTNRFVGGSTDFDDAIESVNQAFAPVALGNNVTFFLSDGQSNIDMRDNSPLADAKAAGTVIHTYSIGSGATGCDEGEALRTIADETSGTCTEVPDPTQLRIELPNTRPHDIDRVEVVAGASGTLTTTLNAVGQWATIIPQIFVQLPLPVTATVYATDRTAVSADILIVAPTPLEIVPEPESDIDEQNVLPVKVFLPFVQ